MGTANASSSGRRRRYWRLGVALALVAGISVPAATVPGSQETAAAAASAKQILFSSNRPAPTDDTVDAEIYLMNPDGSGVTQLTDNTSVLNEETGEETPVDDMSPVWSPDRTKIAYLSLGVAVEEGSIAASQIWVMNADGSAATQLTSSSASEGSNFEPSWSPDGKKIVFRRGDGTGAHVRIIDVATSAETVLPVDLGDIRQDQTGQPAWSPDGRTIVFTAGAGYFQDIYAYSFVTGATVPLATTPAMQESHPAWAPQGQWIAYQRGDESLGAEIWIMNADGSDQRGLAAAPTYSDRKPAFSEDGSQIVFESTRDWVDPTPEDPAEEEEGPPTDPGGGDDGEIKLTSIYVSNADGSGATRITEGGATYSDMTPDWHTPAGSGYTPGGGDDGGGTTPPPADTGGGPSGGGESGPPATAPGPFTPPSGGGGLKPTIVGTNGNDVLRGTPGPDVIFAGDGNDRIAGLGGNDVIVGGAGNDVLYGGDGDDVLNGGDGNDVLYGKQGTDVLYGGAGDDVLVHLPGWGVDRLYAGDGDDDLRALDGNRDWLNGGRGTDSARLDQGLDRTYSIENLR